MDIPHVSDVLCYMFGCPQVHVPIFVYCLGVHRQYGNIKHVGNVLGSLTLFILEELTCGRWKGLVWLFLRGKWQSLTQCSGWWQLLRVPLRARPSGGWP
jgi:hypothetical protein